MVDNNRLVDKKNLLLLLLFVMLFLPITFILATPQITINSPGNITYNTTKVLLNITSNEPVDFFLEDLHGRRTVLGQNLTSLDSFIYFKNGTYNYTIWANNSNGESNESVVFSTTAHNPVNITDCGYLYSSDTSYVFNNDISTDDYFCMSLHSLRNVSLNLNGNTINSGYRDAFLIDYVSDLELFNGTINGSPIYNGNPYGGPWGIEVYGTKLNFHDLDINIHWGIVAWSLHNVVFERVNINSSIGMYFIPVTNVFFKNSSFIWNGYYPTSGATGTDASAFVDFSDHSEIYLEDTNLVGFPEHDFQLLGSFTDIYLRNTNINLSKINYPSWSADTRIFTQHRLLINVTDQFNKTGSGVIEIRDNGLLFTENIFDTLENPTREVLVATDENGTADVWVTEKLTYAKSSSPAVIQEFDFSLYNLTARTWDVDETILLNLTGHHSTIPVIFTLEVPAGKLPSCTISQMLDLNNDEYVNIQDAVIILREIAGLPVSVGTEKECTGVNLNPF